MKMIRDKWARKRPETKTGEKKKILLRKTGTEDWNRDNRGGWKSQKEHREGRRRTWESESGTQRREE